MDIERMKKLLESGIEAGRKVREVRKVMKDYQIRKQDMYDDTAQIMKPTIESQKRIVEGLIGEDPEGKKKVS